MPQPELPASTHAADAPAEVLDLLGLCPEDWAAFTSAVRAGNGRRGLVQAVVVAEWRDSWCRQGFLRLMNGG